MRLLDIPVGIPAEQPDGPFLPGNPPGTTTPGMLVTATIPGIPFAFSH
jgi:hypothetical protein